jgi:hypothetical protein
MGWIYFVFITVFANADYRVHELKIIEPTKQTSRTVQSTLDHYQYQTYHPLSPGEKVTYVQSWKCKGNHSNFADHCPNPRVPASQTP